MTGYSATEAAKLASITYRQLDHWDTVGAVCPDIAIARGSGSNRRYSNQAVIRLRLARDMRSFGISLATLVENDFNKLPVWFASKVIVSEGKIYTSLDMVDSTKPYLYIPINDFIKRGL